MCKLVAASLSSSSEVSWGSRTKYVRGNIRIAGRDPLLNFADYRRLMMGLGWAELG